MSPSTGRSSGQSWKSDIHMYGWIDYCSRTEEDIDRDNLSVHMYPGLVTSPNREGSDCGSTYATSRPRLRIGCISGSYRGSEHRRLGSNR